MNLGINQSFYNRSLVQSNKDFNNNRNISFGDSLGLIKPEAMDMKEFIFNRIKDAGFQIAKKEETKLTKGLVEEHYAGLRQSALEKLNDGKDFLMNIYNRVLTDMQSGPVYKFVIKGDEAEVARFKKFVGATQYQKRDPQSLRGMVESKKVQQMKNAGATEEEIANFRDRYTFIHASDTDTFEGTTLKNYDREIDLHFPGYRKSEK